MSVTATFIKNGPLKMEGEFNLVDSSGKAFEMPAGKPAFLCRCGHSANKPFCDGQHAKQEFESDVKANA